MNNKLICLVWVMACFAGVLDCAVLADAKAAPVRVYIGTYTKDKSHGIYMMDLDRATGALTQPVLAAEMINPSWVTFSPDHKFAYACGEFGTKDGSDVAAFSVEDDGKLKAINEQPMAGGPCYVTVDKTGRNVLAASYGDGHVSVFGAGEDGRLSAPMSTDQHSTTDAQHPPHAHCINPDPADRFVLSCDAGIDKIFVYRFDPAKGVLAANDPSFASLPPSAAPRHLLFSTDGKFVYTIQESASTVTVFTYDPEHGVLHSIQTISTLPADVVAGKGLSTAELLLHPSGKFLYGSNRGNDSIVAYRVDEYTGMLSLIGHVPSQGKTPRGMGIDPTGQWLIAGNQNSDNLTEYRIDPKSGELRPTGLKIECGSPVCVQFVEAGK